MRSISCLSWLISWPIDVRSADAVGVGAVGGLHRQLAHALEDAVDFVQGAFSRLQHRDAVLGVAHGLGVAADLGAHLFANAEAGGVVGGAVDAVAAGELLQHLPHLQRRVGEVALRVERSNVRRYLKTHGCPLSFLAGSPKGPSRHSRMVSWTGLQGGYRFGASGMRKRRGVR